VPVFDVNDIQRVLDQHIGTTDDPEVMFDRVARSMAERWPDQVDPELRWHVLWSAGFVHKVAMLHLSTSEYVILGGAATSSMGATGPFAADLHNFILLGRIEHYGEHDWDVTVSEPGDRIFTPRDVGMGTNIPEYVWFLEYCRGPVPKMFFSMLLGAIVATFDVGTVGRILRGGTAMVVRQWWARTFGDHRKLIAEGPAAIEGGTS
jgi:hypothetical protein